MPMSSELWVAYTRIFFVEVAYWIVSIGMVFANEFVLVSNILTDDLTVFVTMFQILFSLSILISLNHITKKFFIPETKLPKRNFAYNYNYQSKQKSKSSQPSSIETSNNNNNIQEVNDESEEFLKNDENSLIASKRQQEQEQEQFKGDSLASDDSLMSLVYVRIPERINLDTCKLVFPLSILYIGMLLLNNFCLKYVGVAFYFVSRSLTTVFNVAFTYVLMKEPVSLGALTCCGLIVLGFILGIDQESVIGSLSVIGVIFGVASSLFTSLFSIYTKKTLAKLDKNIWVLVLYNNLNAILLCTPLLIVHGDVQALISEKVINPIFWFLLSISGVMAFFISIVTNASIKYTSPLTHNISGTAKACLQTVIAVMYYHDHKSTLWWLSNIIILVASAAYSRIKQMEMERRLVSTSSKQPKDSSVANIKPTNQIEEDARERSETNSSGDSSYQVHFDSCSVKLNQGQSS